MATSFAKSEHVYDASHSLALDLYVPQPPPATPPPLIFFIHGGAIVECRLYFFSSFSEDIIDYVFATSFELHQFLSGTHQLAAAVIDYRLSPKQNSTQIHPMHTKDCANALAWLRAHSETRFDTERIFVAGHSAGGFMAAIIALHPPYLNEFDLPQGIKGFIGVQGIYDLPALHVSFSDYRQYFLEFAFGTDQVAWAAASPTNLSLTAASSRTPWLVIHSREDELVDEKQSLLWMEYLTKNSVNAELRTGTWGLHWDGTMQIGTDKDPISPLIAAFVKRVLSS